MAIPPVYTTNFDHLDLSKKRSFVQLLSPEQMVSWGWRVPSETVCHLAKGWNSPHLCFSLCALCVHCILNMFFSTFGHVWQPTSQNNAGFGGLWKPLCFPLSPMANPLSFVCACLCSFASIHTTMDKKEKPKKIIRREVQSNA